MKAHLSSQIKLDRIPKRYYRPNDAFELTALTRFEKINTEIDEGTEEGSVHIANEISDLIHKCNAENRPCVLALGAGLGTHTVYKDLVRLYKEGKISFSNVVVFNISEFYPLNKNARGTTHILREYLLDLVDIKPENIFTPLANGEKENIFEFCRDYEKKIESYGGIDLALLEMGPLGNLAFNEPGSQIGSTTRLMLLSSESRHNAASLYNSTENVPGSAITIGISTL